MERTHALAVSPIRTNTYLFHARSVTGRFAHTAPNAMIAETFGLED
jgi:hypothetical protein